MQTSAENTCQCLLHSSTKCLTGRYPYFSVGDIPLNDIFLCQSNVTRQGYEFLLNQNY